MMRQFLTPKQLSERWGVTVQTLSNWRHAKKGPRYIKLGGSVRYPISAVERFEKTRRANAKSKSR
jgi:predicted DNA-binding transcriptional regulator AlpA